MTNQSNKVTVIIPVFNTGKYLKQCVESAVSQTYRNLQIILVDDGSTDGTSALCDEIRQMDDRIEVIHKENEGLGLTRNKGLEFTTGEYVTFLDSDDWFSENHIENLLNGLLLHGSDMAIGSHTKYSEEGNVRTKELKLPIYGYFEDNQVKNVVLPEMVAASPTSRLDMGIPMSVCFNLYRTNLIKEHQLTFPSERYCVSEDFFFNYRYVSLCDNVNVVKEYGYFYRNTPMSISHAFAPEQIERVFNFYDEIQKMFFSEPISDDLRERVYRCSLSKVRSLLKRLAASSNSAAEKLKYIRQILNSEQVRDMLANFDYKKYRTSLKMFTIAMRFRLSMVVYAMLCLKK